MDALMEVFERPNFWELVARHVELSTIALVIAVAVSLPVAFAVRNTPLGAAVAINAGNVNFGGDQTNIAAAIALAGSNVG